MPIRKRTALAIDNKPEKSSYVKKADRGFSPPELPLFPGTLDLPELVYKALRDNKEVRPQSRVYASGIKDCARKIGFSLMGFHPAEVGEDHPEWMMTTAIGTAIHSLFERLLPATGLLKNAEFRVESPDGSLSGRVDALLEVSTKVYVASGRREYYNRIDQYILDIKSVSKKDFDEGCWGRKVPGYYQQIQVYGHILGIENGIILLVCRDDGRMQEIEFSIEPEVGAALLVRAAGIKKLADTQTVAPAEALGTFACNFCPFTRQCAMEESTGIVQWELEQGKSPGAI